MENENITADEAFYRIMISIFESLSITGRGCAKTNLLIANGIRKANVPDEFKKIAIEEFFGSHEDEQDESIPSS